ncbi:MAG: N-acetylmuramoyl-L-alanine amidase [Alphaproteobacteria bacterium]|nr:N-acetylmuramoyl-L-alanine amidase [Alphaproteobacteria bacterium]
MLPPQSSFGWRFVVDVMLASEREFASKLGNGHAFTSDGGFNASYSVAQKSNASKKAAEKRASKKVIVLDPGHGGKDPGAIGYSGVYEKNITLAMAKELKKILDKEGKYKVYLTRSTDIFIPLRDRVKIARRYNADLFLSIHADSAVNRSAKGLSVYTLSETASDKEAAALAERENKVDVIAGLNLVEHSKEVSDILINLAQRETMNRSSEFATFMVQEMRKSVKLVDNTHRFAGFAVLKAPDVPSVLLEMGYLSNRTEERLLKQQNYRKKLAASTNKAIEKYFDNMQHASIF